MPGSRKRSTITVPETDPEEDLDDYTLKRKRNNEAVNRTRQKKRQEESETAEKVDKLRKENEMLERKVEGLQKELNFLKEMFLAYANGGKKGNGGEPSTSK